LQDKSSAIRRQQIQRQFYGGNVVIGLLIFGNIGDFRWMARLKALQKVVGMSDAKTDNQDSFRFQVSVCHRQTHTLHTDV
jgi:hypothetical protein